MTRLLPRFSVPLLLPAILTLAALPAWAQEAPWWKSAYAHRQRITVTNNISSTLAKGYSLRRVVDHAALVSGGKSLTSGNDLRVVYWNGVQNVELDRVSETESTTAGTAGDWNTSTTRIWFASQADIAGSGTDNNYYIYYNNPSAGAPPADRSRIYVWFDDFSTNTVGAHLPANGVVTTTGAVTDPFKAIDRRYTGSSNPQYATLSAGSSITLDMGLDEEIIDRNGNDFTVFESGGGESYKVEVADSTGGPWTDLGNSSSSTSNWDLSPFGVSQARYVRISQVGGTPDIQGVHAINMNIPASSRYANGRMNDLHGSFTNVIWHDPVAGVARFDTGDNAQAALRMDWITNESLLVQVDVNVFRTYPINGTFSILQRWTDPNNNFYIQHSQGDYNNPVITEGTEAIGSGSVADPPTNTYFCPIADGTDGGAGDGVGKASGTSSATPCGYTGTQRMRYGLYQLDANNNVHRFWDNTDTDGTPLAENLSYNAGSYATTGVPAVQAAQQWGFFDNLLVRSYVYPEPSAAAGTEQPLTDYKVVALHPTLSAVAQGETDVQILRLTIAAGAADTVTSIKLTSKNTSDLDVTGVTCYYTGSTPFLETTAPFGTQDQTFDGMGEITFSGSRPLAANTSVNFFFVYDVSLAATLTNLLDARIDVGDVTIDEPTTTTYPAAVSTQTDPPGDRQILTPTVLSSVVVDQPVTTAIRPGDTDKEILRIAFTTTGTGSPPSVRRIRVTSANSSDLDVPGVTCWYTGTSATFTNPVAFGVQDQPFGAGLVTFTGHQDLPDGGTPGTFYFFVTYRISPTATGGNLTDAKIAADVITVDTITYPAAEADPAGSRLIQSPTGNVQNLPPVSLRALANPQLDDGVLFAFDNADGGDADAYVDSQQDGLTGPAALPPGDSDYGGLRMANVNITEVVQELWTEFTYDLSSYAIVGRDLNTVTFKGEMYMTGNNTSNPSPSGDTADFYGINDARVQIYNWTSGTWENMGPAFLRPTGADWENPPTAQSEGIVWNNTGDDNPERPLIRSKFTNWTDDFLSSTGEIKTRVWISCTFSSGGGDAHMIFDYAVLDFSYGTRTEEAAYIWTDELEGPVANLNSQGRVGVDQKLHLRVGIRSNGAAFPGHYLGLEVDTDPDFPSPTLVTQSSADIQMWDDTARAEGDPVTVFRIDGATDSGIYHEDEIPPAQNKTADLLYEEDFTVVPVSAGTFYLRVVRMDSSGNVLGLLDAYNQTIELRTFSQQFEQTRYDWAEDAGGDETALDFDDPAVGGVGDNNELEFKIGQTYFLAIQITKESGVQGNVDWQLQFQDFTGGVAVGPWTSMQQGSSGDWTMIDDSATLNTVSNGEEFGIPLALDAAPPAYSDQNGEYSDDGTATSNWNQPNTASYTEWWFSMKANASAAGKSYRFRLIARTNSGAQITGIIHTIYPIAKQTWREQVSTRFAGENEAPVANENTEAFVSTNELLHLRVGLRANHNPWNSANIALQYDTDPNFGSPTLMTPVTAEIQTWDDADHADGDSMTAASLLTGPLTPGTYHEDNDQPAAFSYAQDVLYEEDFTVQVKVAGTYYIRIVEVDAAGAFVAPLFVPAGQGLDAYTQVAKITAVVPINFQTFYNWAPDSAPPASFQTTNTELEYLPGAVYILALQVENRVMADQTYDWQIQYQKINGTPGSWTSITTTSDDWQAANGAYGIDLDPVATGNFACNGGAPRTPGLTAEAGIYTETGSLSDTLTGNSYTEYWFVIKPTALAAGNRYTFRVTNAGSTANFFYEKFGRARQSILEQVSFRWADSNEFALGAENVVYNATFNEQLHLRVGLISHNGTLGSNYFALQYADDFNFTTGVTLMTRTTTDMHYWDDPARAEGQAVAGLLLSGAPFPGIYHEDEIPPAESPTPDQRIEQDFTVQIVSAGTFYLRIVRVDTLGNFVGRLDKYSNVVQITGNPPSADQTSYRFADDAASPTYDPVDTAKELVPTSDYVLAVRVSNLDPMALGWDWQLQYQKTNGTPGTWTDVTAVSADWQAIDGLAHDDGDTIAVASFVTNAPGDGTTAIDGRYSGTGKHTGFSLPVNRNTEFRFGLKATASAAGNAYKFRITNSGSTTGWRYTLFPVARHTRHTQVSYRWADEAEAALDGENAPGDVEVGQLLHLRVGIRSDNNSWAAHKLALQYSTTSNFASPIDVTTSSANVQMWDDSDRSEGAAVAGVMLSGTPTPGIYHEVQDQSATQAKSQDVLTEEDFTVRILTAGVYYLRVVDFTTGSSVILDLYPASPIQITATVPDTVQEAWKWAPNVASPSFQSQDAILSFAVDTPYILAVRLKVQPTAAAGRTLDWQLQYQLDSGGTPGPWTNVTLTSNEWRAVDGLYGSDGAAVATGSFVTTGATGTATAGVYSETGVVSTYTLGIDEYTELWYSFKPIAGSELKKYRFRITDAGATGPFIYSAYPNAAQRHTEQVAFRWAGSNEAAVAPENTIYNALVGEQLHLRAGVRANYIPWGARRFALQYASDINFTSGVTLMTQTTSALKMWDDADHLEGETVTASLLSGSPAAGTYHEDEVHPLTTGLADVVEELDFTVEVVTTGAYFVRVVEVDGAGAFLRALDDYTQGISITGNTPSARQTASNWAADAASPTFGTENAERDIAPPEDLVLALRLYNDGAGSISGDWQLQYQKVNAPPGSWTDVTPVSSDWQAFDGLAGNDGDAVAVANFVTTSPGGGSVDGRYSETGRHPVITLTSGQNTELRYAIRATSAADGNRYTFRLSRSGSPTGILYVQLGKARHIVREQASFIFASAAETAVELENFSFDALLNEQIHLRTGVRSNNSDWSGERFALELDTDPAFGSPAVLLPGAGTVRYWDDTDHAHEASPVTPLLLSQSPDAGRYHETNVVAATEPTLNEDTVTEHDFTVQPNTAGTYYLRTVRVTAGGTFSGLLDKYPASPIRLNAAPLADTQAASNWAPDAGTPVFQTADTTLEFTTNAFYLVAVRVEHTAVAASNFTWQIQYQRDPKGTPGPWTSITTTSTDWRAVNGVYGNHGDAVPTASFSTGAGTGTPVDGVYSETGVTPLYSLANGNYTELWFAVQPRASAEDTLFRFRVTNAGSPLGFLYAEYAHAGQLRTEQVSFRWADGSDLPVEVENGSFTAATTQQLHLRVGIRGNNLPWPSHRLALQYTPDITFATGVTLMTTGTTALRMWDDTDHVADSAVTGPKILAGSPSNGNFHESNVTAAQTRTADTLYEEDFTVEALVNGTYYLRVVEVDAGGAFVRALDQYTPIITLTVATPTNMILAYDWADDAAMPVFKGDNTALFFAPSTIYILAIRVEHSNPESNFDWQIEYQRDPFGTAGPWTLVTTGSAEWRFPPGATLYAKADGGTVPIAEFATTYAGSKTARDGLFDRNGSLVNTLSGDTYTEYWFILEALPGSDLNEYRFRITDSSSPTSFTYGVYPETTSFKRLAGGANWTDGASWTPTGVPTTGQNAMILGTSTMDDAAGVCRILYLRGTANLSVAAGNTLTVEGNLIVRSGGTLQMVAPAGGATLRALGNVTIDSGATMNLTGANTLEIRSGNSLTVNGDFAAASSGGSNPVITREDASGEIDITLNGPVDIDGLETNYTDPDGIDIRSTATLTKFRNVRMDNGSTTAGARYLTITTTGLNVTSPGCFFGTLAAGGNNVSLTDLDGGNDSRMVFEDRGAATSGPGAGEAFDAEAGGAIVEWIFAANPSIVGTVIGFPTAALDWNTFIYYSTYVTARDISGPSSDDRIWVLDADGNLKSYSFTLPQADGDIVGIIWWDTETTTHVVYFGTTTGKVYKLIDDGSSLTVAPGGWPFSNAAELDEVTSPVISDQTNAYFGGLESGSPYFYRLSISSVSLSGTKLSVPSTIRNAPAWDTTAGGHTNLFLATEADSVPSSYLYRINGTTWAVVSSHDSATNTPTPDTDLTTDIVAPVTLRFGFFGLSQVYVGETNGWMHGVDDVTNTFATRTYFPFRDASSAAIKGGAFPDSSTGRIYYGDAAGQLYILVGTADPTWTLGTDYYRVFTGDSTPIEQAVLFVGGVVYAGNTNGTLFCIDESATSVFQTFTFGPGVKLSDIAYDPFTSRVLVGTSDGRFLAIPHQTDPTP